jgi:sulfur-carrier protein
MITIRYFGSLKESLGKSTESVNSSENFTVLDIWHSTNSGALPENTLSAVNMDYVSLTHSVKSGDEVAFFPPVTGG